MIPQTQHDFAVIPEADRLRIEEEHAHLATFLRDLRDTCTEFESMHECHGCGSEKSASCHGRLASFQFDLLDLVAEHFENEEGIMRDNIASPEDSQFFRRHQAEHARLLDEIKNKLIRESSSLSHQGQTVAAIRLLHVKITEIFKHHANEFDEKLLHHAKP